MKLPDVFVRFEINGKIWTYTGRPNSDELREAKWWNPALEAVVTDWFRPENRSNWLKIIDLTADEYFRKLITQAGGRIVEVRSNRPDGSVGWLDLPDIYVH
ncbi:MAG: hypothetical protein KBA71_06065 [Opitutaceae bacterium]|nr:hypothetical protein [Opitutaceae bacterium]